MHGKEVAARDEFVPADLTHRIGQTGKLRVVDESAHRVDASRT